MKQCISKIDTTSILWDEIIEQQFITRWEMPCMKRRNKNESVARHGTYQLTVIEYLTQKTNQHVVRVDDKIFPACGFSLDTWYSRLNTNLETKVAVFKLQDFNHLIEDEWGSSPYFNPILNRILPTYIIIPLLTIVFLNAFVKHQGFFKKKYFGINNTILILPTTRFIKDV